MSKLEKVQKVQAEQAEQAEQAKEAHLVVMLTDADLAITGRGRGRGHSKLYMQAADLPAPGMDGKYAALKTEGHKISAVNNCVQALRRDFPGRQYATRRRGTLIVRIA